VTDTDLITAGDASTPTTSGDGGSLATMVLPELRALANQVGVKGTSGMRKNELIAAIQENQNGGTRSGRAGVNGGGDSGDSDREPAAPKDAENRADNRDRDQNRDQNREQNRDQNRERNRGQDLGPDRDDDGEGRGGRRGRRFRDRRRRGDRPGGDGGPDTELREDDVVQPVAGILDVLDNYAFVRTSGYLAGPNDVYVSMNMVRKNGLRRGDAVTQAGDDAVARRPQIVQGVDEGHDY
jgi:transcription termination factor Rho